MSTFSRFILERSSADDEIWLSEVGLGTRRTPAARIAWFYRVRELDKFAPSEREGVLRDALQNADRGWFVVREVLMGLLCAVCASLLLLPQHWNSAAMALGVAAAFGAPFLLARRETVRQLLRQRRSRER